MVLYVLEFVGDVTERHAWRYLRDAQYARPVYQSILTIQRKRRNGK